MVLSNCRAVIRRGPADPLMVISAVRWMIVSVFPRLPPNGTPLKSTNPMLGTLLSYVPDVPDPGTVENSPSQPQLCLPGQCPEPLPLELEQAPGP